LGSGRWGVAVRRVGRVGAAVRGGVWGRAPGSGVYAGVLKGARDRGHVGGWD